MTQNCPAAALAPAPSRPAPAAALLALARRVLPAVVALAGLGALTPAGAQRIGTITQPLVVAQKTVWPTSNIPVCWEDATGFQAERGWVRQAVARSWEAASLVRFTGWGPCILFSAGVRIRVADVGPHTSGVGRALDSKRNGMTLNFTFNSWQASCKSQLQYCIEVIAIHEFGHAMGITHEHNRSDRLNCTEAHQGTVGDWHVTGYDPDSVMNYCNPSWNGNGRLSFFDRLGSVVLYGGWSPEFAVTPPGAAGGGSDVVSLSRARDHIDLFWVGSDGAVGTNFWGASVNNAIWTRPFAISAPGSAQACSKVSAVSRAPGQVDVFWVGRDGAVMTNWWNARANNGAWNRPFAISPPGAARSCSPVTAVSRGPELLDVFWIGPDGGVGTNWWNARVNNGAWNRPFPIAPPNATRANSPLTAVSRVPDHIDVFWIGPDGAVGSNFWSARVNNGAWNRPFPITPPGATRANSPLVADSRLPEHVDVFWIGPDGAVGSTYWNARVNNAAWNRPFPITPPGATRANSPLAASSRLPEHVDVFWIGPDGAIGTTWWSARANNGAWNRPFAISGPNAARGDSLITTGPRTGNNIDVFWTGPDGAIGTAFWFSR